MRRLSAVALSGPLVLLLVLMFNNVWAKPVNREAPQPVEMHSPESVKVSFNLEYRHSGLIMSDQRQDGRI